MLKLLKMSFLITLLTGCGNNEINPYPGYKEYLIKKGNHYSNGFSINFNNFEISKDVIFTESCQYTLNSEDQADINKLFGLSDGINHSKWSARFGWRYYKNNIEILAYVRSNKKIIFHILGTTKPDEVVHCKLQIFLDKYRFIFNENVYDVPRNNKYDGYRYALKPYFGGNNPAPHDIKIYMK